MDRDLSGLFQALVHVGTVEAVRQEYRVYRTAGGDFIVVSPSSRGSSSFHMAVVQAPKVEALAGLLGKDGVTTGSLMKDEKLADAFGASDKVATRFDLLMALYVLTAKGEAEMKKEGRSLIFSRRKA